MKKFLTIAIVPVVLMWAGCSSKSDSGKTNTQAAKPDAAAMANIELGGTPVTLAGITFTPPTAWKDLGPSGMRKAEYCFGPIGSDKDSATVTAFYFGPSGGGGIDANINRWIGQMKLPDGADPEKAITREETMVDGMKVHTVQLAGTYNASMGGPMMGGKTMPMEGYMMSAVVLEAPQGNVFFKLTGPKETATQMNVGFHAMLAAIKKSGDSM
jgi:hypothetical protein